MTQNEKDLLFKDLCARLPYGVKCEVYNCIGVLDEVTTFYGVGVTYINGQDTTCRIDECKPYLFPLSSMTDDDHTMYFKIWEDTGKMAYLEGCHPQIINIKAYKAANDYLLSKHYDINGLIPKDLANDATGLNIY